MTNIYKMNDVETLIALYTDLDSGYHYIAVSKQSFNDFMDSINAREFEFIETETGFYLSIDMVVGIKDISYRRNDCVN